MRLGLEDVTITAPDVVTLRPTLRAAFRLEQKYNGFHNLFNAVAGFSLSAVSDVIKEGTGQSSALTDYLDQAGDTPLAVSMELLIDPIVKFLYALAGIEAAIDVQAGKPVAFVEYHKRLFRIATGWLGWSSEQAWNATPAEILEAYEGRREMLGAIFGGGKQDDDNVIDFAKHKVDQATRNQLNAVGDLTQHSLVT